MTEQERDIAMVEVEKKPLAGLIEVSLQSSISSATKLFSTYPLRILHPKRFNSMHQSIALGFIQFHTAEVWFPATWCRCRWTCRKIAPRACARKARRKCINPSNPHRRMVPRKADNNKEMESKRLSKRSRQKLERTRFSVGYRTRHSVSKTQSLSKCTRFHCRMILLAYVSWIGSPLGELHTTMRDGHFVCFPRERP